MEPLRHTIATHARDAHDIDILGVVRRVLQVLYQLPESIGLGLDLLRRRLCHNRGCCLMVSVR